MTSPPTARHLDHAPIHEAVLDVQIDPLGISALDNLKKLAGQVEDYPRVDERRQFEGLLQWDRDGSRAQMSSPIVGYRVLSADERQLLQFRLNGMSANRLKPYLGWNELLAEFKRYWASYLEIAGNTRIHRIAVRTINHLPLPNPSDDPHAAILSLPSVPEAWPQMITGLFCRMTLEVDQAGTSAHIIHHLSDSLNPDSLVVVLDIDAFRKVDMSTDDASLWQVFEELHTLKNKLFFSALDEEYVRSFE